MKIEAGKYYINGLGEKRGPMKIYHDPKYSFQDENRVYTSKGKRYKNADYAGMTNLIAEWEVSSPAAEPEWGEWIGYANFTKILKINEDYQAQRINGDVQYRVRKAPPAPVVMVVTIGHNRGMDIVVDIFDGEIDRSSLRWGQP